MGRTTINIPMHGPEDVAFIRRTLGIAEGEGLPEPQPDNTWNRPWNGYRKRQPMTRARRNRQATRFGHIVARWERRAQAEAKARRADQKTWGSIDLEADGLYADLPGLSQLAELRWVRWGRGVSVFDDEPIDDWDYQPSAFTVVRHTPPRRAATDKPRPPAKPRVQLPPHLRVPECEEQPSRERYSDGHRGNRRAWPVWA